MTLLENRNRMKNAGIGSLTYIIPHNLLFSIPHEKRSIDQSEVYYVAIGESSKNLREKRGDSSAFVKIEFEKI